MRQKRSADTTAASHSSVMCQGGRPSLLFGLFVPSTVKQLYFLIKVFVLPFLFLSFFFCLSGVAFHFVPACMPPHLSVFCVLIFSYPFPPKEKKMVYSKSSTSLSCLEVAMTARLAFIQSVDQPLPLLT